MTLGEMTNLLAAVTVIEMMATIGLGVVVKDALGAVASGRLLLRAALANYLVVPAMTLGLLALFRPHPMVAAGFLVTAVCPGAPFAPPLTALARGNAVLAVAMMVLLAASSAILAPVLLQLLLPLVAGEQALTVDAVSIVRTLLVVQLLPLAAGLVVRHYRPLLATQLLPPCTAVSKLLNLALVVLILATQFGMLAQIRPMGYGGMLALVAASVVAGSLAGAPGRQRRRTLAITTSVRNVGVGLVIATSTFSGTPAVAAATAFGLFQTMAVLALAFWWSRDEAPSLARAAT